MTPLSRPQLGFSIIEIMVALALSLILTLGLVQIFTSNSQSFRLAEASSRLQETGRLSGDLLGRAVRNADYFGCLKDVGGLNSIINADTGGAFDHEQLLRGLDAENDIADGTAAPGTDRLYVGGIDANTAVEVSFQPSQAAANLKVTDVSNIAAGDILIVSNCKGGDIFQVTNQNPSNITVVHQSGNGSTSPGNSTPSLSTNYNDDPDGASVFKPTSHRFFVRETGGIRELMIQSVNVNGGTAGVGTYGAAVALFRGVSDFQLQLGRDTNGDGAVDAWSDPEGLTVSGRLLADQAVAVRMSILVRSQADNVLDGSPDYCFPGWLDCVSDATLLTTAGDRRLYRVYNSVAMIRNRL